MKYKNKILVTQPSLPPLKDFIETLEKIWESKWLTNNIEFQQEFEEQLTKYLGIAWLFNIGEIRSPPSFIKQK